MYVYLKSVLLVSFEWDEKKKKEREIAREGKRRFFSFQKESKEGVKRFF